MFEHFTSDESEDNRIAMVDRLRGNILSMDGHLKWRVIDLFETEPLMLLIRMVHPKLPASEQLQAAIEFYQIPECDLALHNGLKVRRLFPGPHSMFQDEDFRKSVRRVAKVFKLTNMHMERVLAGIKTVSPGKHPNVERIMAAGYMSQLCTAHTQAGGMCPTATCSTKQLMKDGAPLRATARLKRAKCGKKTRPDMLAKE